MDLVLGRVLGGQDRFTKGRGCHDLLPKAMTVGVGTGTRARVCFLNRTLNMFVWFFCVVFCSCPTTKTMNESFFISMLFFFFLVVVYIIFVPPSVSANARDVSFPFWPIFDRDLYQYNVMSPISKKSE